MRLLEWVTSFISIPVPLWTWGVVICAGALIGHLDTKSSFRVPSDYALDLETAALLDSLRDNHIFNTLAMMQEESDDDLAVRLAVWRVLRRLRVFGIDSVSSWPGRLIWMDRQGRLFDVRRRVLLGPKDADGAGRLRGSAPSGPGEKP